MPLRNFASTQSKSKGKRGPRKSGDAPLFCFTACFGLSTSVWANLWHTRAKLSANICRETTLYPTWSRAGALVHLDFTSMLKNLAGPFCCASVMGIFLWMSDHWILGSQALGLRLALQVFLGTLAYGFLIRLFRLEARKDVQRIFLEKGRRRSRFILWIAGGSPPDQT